MLKNTDFIIHCGNNGNRLKIRFLFTSCCLTNNLLFFSVSQMLSAFAAVFLLVTFQCLYLLPGLKGCLRSYDYHEQINHLVESVE